MTNVIANPGAQTLGRYVSRAGQLLRVLEEAGLSAEAEQRPIDDPDFRRELVAWWEGRVNPPTAEVAGGSCPVALAADIMGGNIHGVGALKRHFGSKSAGRQKVFQTVPFDAEALHACKDTHVLVPVLPLSLVQVHERAAEVFSHGQRQDPWFGESRQEFARAEPPAGWYLVRKDEVPGSTNTHWDEQKEKLAADEFVPKASVAAQAAILHCLETGERMFSRIWVRTDDVTANGSRVSVRFVSDGFFVRYWFVVASSRIGVAAARKSG